MRYLSALDGDFGQLLTKVQAFGKGQGKNVGIWERAMPGSGYISGQSRVCQTMTYGVSDAPIICFLFVHWFLRDKVLMMPRNFVFFYCLLTNMLI